MVAVDLDNLDHMRMPSKPSTSNLFLNATNLVV